MSEKIKEIDESFSTDDLFKYLLHYNLAKSKSDIGIPSRDQTHVYSVTEESNLHNLKMWADFSKFYGILLKIKTSLLRESIQKYFDIDNGDSNINGIVVKHLPKMKTMFKPVTYHSVSNFNEAVGALSLLIINQIKYIEKFQQSGFEYISFISNNLAYEYLCKLKEYSFESNLFFTPLVTRAA